MSLRSSFTKLVGTLSSRKSLLRATWAATAGLAGVMTMSTVGGGCNGSNSLECDSNGQNCKICDAYGCRPANSEGTGGSGGATGSGAGGAGGTTATSGTATTTSSGTGGGSGINDLACNSEKPCPSPQVCLSDGFCHRPCTDLLDCKHYDNRFTACVDGYCE